MAEGDKADDFQKTEEPTAKKLQEARKKGQVPMSREVNNWIMLAAGTLVVATMMGPALVKMTNSMAFYIARAHEIPYGAGGVAFALDEGFKNVVEALAGPIIFLTLAAFLAPFLQIGPLFSAETLKPEFSKISPARGMARLFSRKSLIEFAKGILKISLVGMVGTVVIMPYFSGIEHVIDLAPEAFMQEMKDLTVRMLIGMLVVLLIIAVIDLIYQRMDHYKNMRMTKQELKDEYKQTEGDPQVKAKLRQLRSNGKKAHDAGGAQGRCGDHQPDPLFHCLQYDPEEMEAPICVAKGLDALALRIREVAQEHDVILYENKPLAQALYKAVEVDEMIPFEHFKAVAEVISYVFKQRGTSTVR